MSSRSQAWISVALTGVAGVAALAAALLFRDQLPLAPGPARVLGFGTLYAGMALFLWAAMYLRNALGGAVAPRLDHFVITGPFRFVRHPAYLGMTVAMIGASIVTRSLAGLLLTLLVFLPVELHRARLEDQALEQKFGAEWTAYAARTGFLLPYLGRRRPL